MDFVKGTGIPRYQSYIICTSPRSGSTLLCKLLEATGQSGHPGSHFHQPSIAAWLDDYGLSDRHFADPVSRLSAIFEAARQTGTGTTGMFGLRLQRHSFDFFMQKLAVLHPDQTHDADRIQTAFGRTLFIHLTRDNKLDQAISRVIAEQSGLWHKAADGSELERLSAPQTPTYDAARISEHITTLTAYDAQWQRWFDQQRLSPVRVSYDDLSHAPAQQLARILDALDLDPALATDITAPTAKLSDQTNQAWAQRYQAEASTP
nr:Stf0 family sulfotransferase [Falsiruegeria litorea]